MSTTPPPVFANEAEEMAVSGEHLLAVEARLAAITSVGARRRWYLRAVGVAVAGGCLTAALHRGFGLGLPFVAGFMAMAIMNAGFGPVLLGGWGTYAIAFLLEGATLAPNEQERVRFAAGLVLLLVGAWAAEILRRTRLQTIDREFRLSQALRRSEELRRQREQADLRQQVERDQAAAALRARDETLTRITATVPGVVYQLLWYPDGRNCFTFVSERAWDLFAIDPVAAIADSNVAWSRMHPDDVAVMRRSAIESATSLEPWRCEFRIDDHTKPDHWRWLLGSATCQPAAQAGCALFTGIFTDITEQRHFEERLRQSQRIESIGRLAGGVAHDFNNLLTAITGEASLLESDVPPAGDVAQGLARIRAAAESGAALSRQLLGFARRQVMSPQIIDVTTMMVRAAPLLRRLLPESTRLELRVDPDTGAVRVDPGLFDQVLLNLAANARDAMPAGGTFSVTVCRVRSDSDDRRRYAEVVAGDVVEFVVTDTGTGMSPAVRERAFEPFFTTKALGDGTGLGLSTSYGIVAQVGGVMLLESVEGQGTTVRLVLPGAASLEPVVVPDGRLPRRGTERVLVVDDDDQVRRVTAEALRRHGYDVIEASGGREAIAMAKASDPAVALLVSDVVMPELSGVDVVNAMTREGLTPRVLYVSGYPEGTITQHGVVPEGVELLVKPYAVVDLLHRVRTVLDRNSAVAAA